jgi:hypothetical protein
MKTHQLFLIGGLASTLAACGGSSSSSPGTEMTLNGTAATGLAISGATVNAKCSGGTGSTTTATDGTYKVVIENGALPCVLQVIHPADGKKLHAININGGVANLTPLTEMLSVRLMRTDMTTVFANMDPAAITKAVTPTTIKAAQTDIETVLQGIVDTSTLTDFYGTPLKAASTGNTTNGDAQDKLLDTLKSKMNGTQFTQTLSLLANAAPAGQPTTNVDTTFVPTITIQPMAVTMTAGVSRSLIAGVNYPPNVFYIRQPVSWSVVEAGGGTIDSNGLYVAPQKPGTYHVKAQREDFPNVSTTAVVTVSSDPMQDFTPELTVLPQTLTLSASTVYNFTAAINYPPNVFYIREPVSWSVVEADGGTINLNGLYVAPQKAGVYHVKAQRDDYPDLSVIVEVVIK